MAMEEKTDSSIVGIEVVFMPPVFAVPDKPNKVLNYHVHP